MLKLGYMFKRICLVLLCLTLCACDNATAFSTSKLDSILSDETRLNVRQNNYTDYIDYYLPSDVQEDESNKLAFSFMCELSKLVMNVNIADIINSKYHNELVLSDEGFFDEDKLIFEKKGSYVNYRNEKMPFIYRLYEYDNKYVAYFSNTDINIYGLIHPQDVEFVTDRIYTIAKGSDVDRDLIIVNYSSKDVIDYHKTQVNLFESSFPIEGRIDDLMIDSGNQTLE